MRRIGRSAGRSALGMAFMVMVVVDGHLVHELVHVAQFTAMEGVEVEDVHVFDVRGECGTRGAVGCVVPSYTRPGVATYDAAALELWAAGVSTVFQLAAVTGFMAAAAKQRAEVSA